jgi:hypothetical protein
MLDTNTITYKTKTIKLLNKIAKSSKLDEKCNVQIGTIREHGKHYEFPYFTVKSTSDMAKLVSIITRSYDECLVDYDGENFEICLERTILKNLPIKNKQS